MSSLEMTSLSFATRVGLHPLARAIGLAALAGAVAFPQAAAAVGRTEPAAQMRENPLRGQELRRQLLEHYGLDMVQRERQRNPQPADAGRELDGLRGVKDGLPPSDPATIAPGLAPSIAPTIAPTATPVKVPAIDAVMDPSSALPVPPSAPLADPAARPGGGPLVDRPVASPVATPALAPMDAATVAPVGKVRLTEDERLLLREQLRGLPRRGPSLRD